MKSNLVKQGDRWVLYGEDGSKIASSAPNPMGKLSVKNCEAIENGYDLDELAESEYGTVIESVRGSKEYDIEADRKSGFKTGFKKALEILGDKKFSEEDLRLAMHFGKFGEANSQTTTIGFIKSLQQTEWDVEIVMENSLTNGYKNQPENVIGFIAEYKLQPKLDADGCLILRRI